MANGIKWPIYGQQPFQCPFKCPFIYRRFSIVMFDYQRVNISTFLKETNGKNLWKLHRFFPSLLSGLLRQVPTTQKWKISWTCGSSCRRTGEMWRPTWAANFFCQWAMPWHEPGEVYYGLLPYDAIFKDPKQGQLHQVPPLKAPSSLRMVRWGVKVKSWYQQNWDG